MSRRRRPYLPIGCIAPLLLLIVAILAGMFVPVMAAQTYGPASPTLGGLQLLQYSALMVWHDGRLTRPLGTTSGEQEFSISSGEPPASVAVRLEQAGLIRDADAFRDYLIYSGLDTGIQAGNYTLSPALSSMQIAERLQDATPAQVKFVVLPGWRMEEIAASMPTSGLDISPEQFLAAARDPRAGLDFLPPGASAEGMLFPDEYTLPRAMQADQLVGLLISHFATALTPEMRAAFSRQGLDVYQAVSLASIIQREAVQQDEQPVIASVFLNRLAAGMTLGADPTIQYALGFDAASGSWWKSPLTADDLAVVSPYNTYNNPGLPPGPISNPSLSALQAVANPAKTNYLYFRARCDGSGRHAFAETYDQQLQNACP